MPDALDLYPLLVLTVVVAAAPFVVVATTAFAKIAVVLFIVRSAVGVQQTPPNIVLYAIALVLTGYVMAPVFAAIGAIVGQGGGLDLGDAAATRAAAEAIAAEISGFMLRFTEPEHRAFFLSGVGRLWPEAMAAAADDDDLMILVPAFMTSELTRAFEIGVLIYLPFVIIDLVVTNVTTALGMMTVQPTTLALPFKLLLFVAVDGWSRLTQSLVLSYT